MAGAKILIVEDEMITGCAIAEQLKRIGYEVTGFVSSGEAAIASVAALVAPRLRPDQMLVHCSGSVPLAALGGWQDGCLSLRFRGSGSRDVCSSHRLAQRAWRYVHSRAFGQTCLP